MAINNLKRKERESNSSNVDHDDQASGFPEGKRPKTDERRPKLPPRKPRKKCLPTKSKPPIPKLATLPPGLVRFRKLWFRGGDIIVKADQTLFRVHKEKLTSMGGILENMLDVDLASLKPDDWIDSLPVIEFTNVFDTSEEVSWFLRFIHNRFRLVTFPKEAEYPIVKWNATMAFLHAGHKMSMFEVRNAAIEALSYIFFSGEHVPNPNIKPRILGLSPTEKATFAKLHVFQMVKAVDQYEILAMKPMAFYQAAQFSIDEIMYGVPRPDGTKEQLPINIIGQLMSLRESLKRTRRVESFSFLSDLSEDGKMLHYPSPDCPNMPRPSGSTCFYFLPRLYFSLCKKGFIDSTPNCLFVTFDELTLRVLNKHLCKSCMSEFRKTMAQSTNDVWKALPRHFGFEGWTELLYEQRKLDKAWLPESESI